MRTPRLRLGGRIGCRSRRSASNRSRSEKEKQIKRISTSNSKARESLKAYSENRSTDEPHDPDDHASTRLMGKAGAYRPSCHPVATEMRDERVGHPEHRQDGRREEGGDDSL